MQGRKCDTHMYCNLMDLEILTYNNLEEDDKVEKKRKNSNNERNNYLALVTQLIDNFGGNLKSGIGINDDAGTGLTNNYQQRKPKVLPPWRFENDTNTSTKVVYGVTMK